MDQQPPPEPRPVVPVPSAPPPPGEPPSAVPPQAPLPPAAAPPPPAPAPAPPQSWSTSDQASAPPAWKSDPAPAGPAPGVEFAGYGARIIAYLIDWLIIGLFVGILWAVIGIVVMRDGDATFLAATLIAVSILLWLLYFPYFWHRNGQTPGMKPFRIRVVRDRDGGPITWLPAFLRLIGYSINAIILGIPIGFLWVFFDKRRRGWHDLIGGTVVIKG